MKKTKIIYSLFLMLFFCSISIAQNNEAWVLTKSPELNQPFGYVWLYNNTQDESHKNCKGHEHTIQPLKKPSQLKKSVTVNSPIFKLGYAQTGSNQTKISYTVIDKSGTIVLQGIITLNNSSEIKWSTTNIDLSNYQNQDVTLIINIDEQPDNSSLFINLFQ